MTTLHSHHRGWAIWTRNYCGMWKATKADHTPLAADTLAGMRQIITHTERKS